MKNKDWETVIGGVEYENAIPSAKHFYSIYNTTRWNSDKGKEELYNAIQNSWYQISAYFDNQLIGYGRVISDGYLHAFIVDLIIVPSYQGKGIGNRNLELISFSNNSAWNSLYSIILC